MLQGTAKKKKKRIQQALNDFSRFLPNVGGIRYPGDMAVEVRETEGPR